MVWTGKNVRGASLFGAPKTLGGKAFKAPSTRIPMAGSAFMLYMRGFQAAARGFHKLEKDTVESVHAGVLKVWMRIFRRSQETCPVKTARLAYSGRMLDKSRELAMPGGTGRKQFIDMHIMYGGGNTGVDYAVYVHEGHTSENGKFVRGNPWLVKAARSHKRQLFRACKPSIQYVWNRFVKQIHGYGSKSKWDLFGAAKGKGATGLGYRMKTGAGVRVSKR